MRGTTHLEVEAGTVHVEEVRRSTRPEVEAGAVHAGEARRRSPGPWGTVLAVGTMRVVGPGVGSSCRDRAVVIRRDRAVVIRQDRVGVMAASHMPACGVAPAGGALPAGRVVRASGAAWCCKRPPPPPTKKTFDVFRTRFENVYV